MTAWHIGKWPVLVVAVGFIFALLYFAAPNVRHPSFRTVLPGGLLAVAIWIAASLGFGLYVGYMGAIGDVNDTHILGSANVNILGTQECASRREQ